MNPGSVELSTSCATANLSAAVLPFAVSDPLASCAPATPDSISAAHARRLAEVAFIACYFFGAGGGGGAAAGVGAGGAGGASAFHVSRM
jgi:hypothetical protein